MVNLQFARWIYISDPIEFHLYAKYGSMDMRYNWARLGQRNDNKWIYRRTETANRNKNNQVEMLSRNSA